jgi:RNA polymerase sigma-70 factor, ECF subfamily
MLIVMNNPNPLSDEPSFAELMGRHQPRLIGYIRSMIPDPHAAKDILQETNMTLLRKHGDFQKGSNFTAWAFRIAYFEVLSWRRNQGRERLQFSNELVESIAQAGEALAVTYDSRLDALKLCLEKLPERQRTVVQLHYLNGTPVQEVAEEMNFKANAASQLLHRARLNLFKCINQLTRKS